MPTRNNKADGRGAHRNTRGTEKKPEHRGGPDGNGNTEGEPNGNGTPRGIRNTRGTCFATEHREGKTEHREGFNHTGRVKKASCRIPKCSSWTVDLIVDLISSLCAARGDDHIHHSFSSFFLRGHFSVSQLPRVGNRRGFLKSSGPAAC